MYSKPKVPNFVRADTSLLKQNILLEKIRPYTNKPKYSEPRYLIYLEFRISGRRRPRYSKPKVLNFVRDDTSLLKRNILLEKIRPYPKKPRCSKPRYLILLEQIRPY